MSIKDHIHENEFPPVEFDDVVAANQYVKDKAYTADEMRAGAPMWYGWGLREAFLAGVEYGKGDK